MFFIFIEFPLFILIFPVLESFSCLSGEEFGTSVVCANPTPLILLCFFLCPYFFSLQSGAGLWQLTLPPRPLPTSAGFVGVIWVSKTDVVVGFGRVPQSHPHLHMLYSTSPPPSPAWFSLKEKKRKEELTFSLTIYLLNKYFLTEIYPIKNYCNFLRIFVWWTCVGNLPPFQDPSSAKKFPTHVQWT